MNKFVKIIEQQRKAQEFSYAELARRSGVNARTLNGWAHGVVKPNIEDVEKALKGLGLELRVCFGEV